MKKKKHKQKSADRPKNRMPAQWAAKGVPVIMTVDEATRTITQAKTEDRFDLPEEMDESAPNAEKPKAPQARPRTSAMTAIVGSLFDASIPRDVRRRLNHAKALAVVVLVPGPAWVVPAEIYFRDVFGTRWIRHARDGAAKSSQKPSGDSDEAARDLARGRCVVGFAADASHLPSTLVTAADITIRLSAPTGPVLRTAITRFARRSPGDLAEGHAVGLDLSDIVAAFRPGSGAERIAQRLANSASIVNGTGGPRESIPDLSSAVEYGAAQKFGLGLARDVRDYRLGIISWCDLPRGIVLHGEVGTGKSLYARMLASACELPLVSTTVADWFTGPRGGYLHDVIAQMRGAFDRATSLAGANGCCLLFMDELDSVPNRLTLDNRNSDYWKPLCNDLLTRLDNSMSDTRRGIIVVSATNNLSAIDPALMRPGRLELAIEIERPDFAGTLNILRHHAPDLPHADLSVIASLAERSTGAEIMYLVREARRRARHAGRALTLEDLKSTLMPKIEVGADGFWRICLHEAGHATAALCLQSGTVRRIVVGYRVGSGGHTLIEADKDNLLTRERLEDRAITLLAGRSAERVVLGSESAGATGDLESVTQIVASMHASAGMGDTIAFLAPAASALDALRMDPGLQARVEYDLQLLQRRADEIIRRERAALIAIAVALRDHRYLSGEAAREIFLRHVLPAVATPSK